MKISIITPTYNSANTVKDTIDSVLSQEYKDIEYIIIDGDSKDKTIEIIKSYGSKITKFISEKDGGIYDAMNKGIKLASGDIIGILNSDDFYVDAFVLSDIADIFINNDVDSVYGDLNYVEWNNTGNITRKWIAGDGSWQSFKFGWHPPHPTFFVKKELYTRFGLFRSDLKIAADYELMLRFIYVNRASTAYLKRVLVKMRQGGVSSNGFLARTTAYSEDRRAWLLNNIKPSIFTIFMKKIVKLGQWFH